ncbi:MAG: hypothetical protein ABSH35_37295, partial [Isosphaeraceae bacterium]
ALRSVPSGAALRAYLTGHGSHALGGPVFLLKIGSEFLLGPRDRRLAWDCSREMDLTGEIESASWIFNHFLASGSR